MIDTLMLTKSLSQNSLAWSGPSTLLLSICTLYFCVSILRESVTMRVLLFADLLSLATLGHDCLREILIVTLLHGFSLLF